MFATPVTRPRDRGTFVIFPHAGGSVAHFSVIWSVIPASVLVAQLPGRGSLLRDPQAKDMDELSSSFASALSVYPSPIILFGYSFGALLAVEVSRKMQRCPAAVIVAGMDPPHLYSPLHILSSIRSNEDFLRAVSMEYGGLISDQLFIGHGRDLIDIVAPSLRNDLRMCEEYQWHGSISCKTIVYASKIDPHTPHVDKWGDIASSCEIHILESTFGHSFVLRDPAFRLALSHDVESIIAAFK